MKIRYAETARRELDEAVNYLIEHAPRAAAAFADNIESAEAELLRNPYSAQETEFRGVRSKYISTLFATACSIWSTRRLMSLSS
jgi:plasmid stabilization system protein ParE